MYGATVFVNSFPLIWVRFATFGEEPHNLGRRRSEGIMQTALGLKRLYGTEMAYVYKLSELARGRMVMAGLWW